MPPPAASTVIAQTRVVPTPDESASAGWKSVDQPVKSADKPEIVSGDTLTHRPGAGRVVARAAPGTTRHFGRRSFGGGGRVRHQFRPSTAPPTGEPPAAPGVLTRAPGSDLNPKVPSAVESRPITGVRENAAVPTAPGTINPATSVDNEEIFEPAMEAGLHSHEGGVSASDLPISATNHTAAVVPAGEADATSAAQESKIESARGRQQGPPRQMLINAQEKDEVRIAVICQGRLEELYVERTSTELHVGNIYKGRVLNVEPSIQAAFIDFGIGRNGFLHISDLHPQYFPGHAGRAGRPATGAHKPAAGESPDNTAPSGDDEREAPEGVYGDIYPQLADELLEAADLRVDQDHILPMEKVGRKTPRHSRPPIQQCLRRGQEIIVQVTKEGIGNKGPTLTSYISVPGRYLVMMPGMSQLGVSRKIENIDQRRALKKILQELNPPHNLGFIIRTAGIDRTRRELQQDLHYLVRLWKRIAHRLETLPAPAELYQESDLVIRTIRDLVVHDMDRILVDDAAVAERVRDFLSIVSPRSAEMVSVYSDALPLFQRHNVEQEIEKINARRVEMSNGGSLVIDSTEALVAIDVNSGRYREHRDAELTSYNINKDAVQEICRQLRLRDLGGVIVIDLIDMREDRHKRDIERLLRDQLKQDRAKTKVLRMSQFCMIEMTRQRVKPSLKRGIYQDCPYCHGAALIKNPESVSLDVLRRLAAAALHRDAARIEARVHSLVAAYLLNRKRRRLVELENTINKQIHVLSDSALPGDAVLMEVYDVRGNLLNVKL